MITVADCTVETDIAEKKLMKNGFFIANGGQMEELMVDLICYSQLAV